MRLTAHKPHYKADTFSEALCAFFYLQTRTADTEVSTGIGINYIHSGSHSHHFIALYNRGVFLRLTFLSYRETLMSKLQAGGLAMIISANVPENIGKIVELLTYLGPSKSDVSNEVAPAWYVKCEAGLVTTEGNKTMRGGIFSRRLMPLDRYENFQADLHQKEIADS